MSITGDAAGQIVDLATNGVIKGATAAMELAGKGVITLASFLIALVRSEKKKGGKVNVKLFSDKTAEMFYIKNQDLHTFRDMAKKYGMKFAVVVNEKNPGPNTLCDIMVDKHDAAKANRILQNFALDHVNVYDEKNRQITNILDNCGEPDKNGFRANDELVASVYGEERENPTMARMETMPAKNLPSEPKLLPSSLNAQEKSTEKSMPRDIGTTIEERPSVRGKIEQIKADRAQEEGTAQKQTTQRQNTHIDPQRGNKPKRQRNHGKLNQKTPKLKGGR